MSLCREVEDKHGRLVGLEHGYIYLEQIGKEDWLNQILDFVENIVVYSTLLCSVGQTWKMLGS